MEKFIDRKTNKVILQIDDEGNETRDEKYFEDIAEEKKKLEDKIKELETKLKETKEARDV